MANQEQLNILKQGIDEWNDWRMEHPEIIHPDLSETDPLGEPFMFLNGADLSGANLSGANLSQVYLTKSTFFATNLSGANLRSAVICNADLFSANLSRADLSRASLNGANLRRANLRGANLCGADLMGGAFNGTELNRANFNGAMLGWTIFGDVDLQTVKGLETVDHRGPSTIGTDTILRSDGNIPEVFLRKAGMTDTFITYARSLAQKPIDYFTCFISHSTKDYKFAEQLYADLQAKGVRCWYAPEDLKIGEEFPNRIEEAIRLYDKLLVIFSEHSVKSSWVEDEVSAALEKEEQFKREQQPKTVLFPIKIDDAIEQEQAQWVAMMRRRRHIGDFTLWKEHDKYQKAFHRLLRDLKAE